MPTDDIKITNTPYDDVFRTLLNDCSSLIYYSRHSCPEHRRILHGAALLSVVSIPAEAEPQLHISI